MGSCISRGSSAADDVQPPTMAKVITVAGALKEYPSHLTAANVLAVEVDGASCFVCSSDDLFYDYPIPPLALQQRLLPGQLYFVLPAEKLRYPLSRSDVGDLLMRANSALQLAVEPGKDGRGRKRKSKKKKRKGKRDGAVVGPEPRVDGCGRGEDEARKSEVADQVNHQVAGQRDAPSTAQGGPRRRRSGTYVRCRYGYRLLCSAGARLSTIPEEEEEAAAAA